MRPLTREEVRAVDQVAIAEFGLPGVVLMENAGRGTAELLLRLGVAGPVVICAGKGNNGGDGFVIARHLDLHDIPVEIVLTCAPAELTGDAAINCRVAQVAGIPLAVLDHDLPRTQVAARLARADWIVDALLGTGARGAPQAPLAALIDAINAAGKRVLAVDVPSGLDCDLGRPAGSCVRATATATFVAPKVGFSAPGAADYTGDVHVIDIGIPRRLRERVFASPVRAAGG